MGKVLSENGSWACEKDKAKIKRCNAILGDRFDIPYHLLRERTRTSFFQQQQLQQQGESTDDASPTAAASPPPSSSFSGLIINYFKGSHRLTLKASMAKLLRDVPGIDGVCMPRTFVLGGKSGDKDERDKLQAAMAPRDDEENEKKTKRKSATTWIVKPSSGCKGSGILISDDFGEIVAFVDQIKKKKEEDEGKKSDNTSAVAEQGPQEEQQAMQLQQKTSSESSFLGIVSDLEASMSSTLPSPSFELTPLSVTTETTPMSATPGEEGDGGEGKKTKPRRARYPSFREAMRLKSTPTTAGASNDTSPAPLFAVQEYIANPMLLPGRRKFDIRVWVLLSTPYDIYIFNQGSCRTASEPYNPDDLKDTLSHLTNHCLQEKGRYFNMYEEGNEMWYDAFEQFLRAEYAGATTPTPTTATTASSSKQEENDKEEKKKARFSVSPPVKDCYMNELVKPQIAHIVVQSLVAIRDMIEVNPEVDNYDCFQLFGFDFMLDDGMRAHLIEINGSPGSAEKWLDPLVRGMADILFTPERFPPLQQQQQQQRLQNLPTNVSTATAANCECGSATAGETSMSCATTTTAASSLEQLAVPLWEKVWDPTMEIPPMPSLPDVVERE